VNAEVADVHALCVLQDEGQQQNQDHREERDGYPDPGSARPLQEGEASAGNREARG
jgi:hypothetical protein